MNQEMFDNFIKILHLHAKYNYTVFERKSKTSLKILFWEGGACEECWLVVTKKAFFLEAVKSGMLIRSVRLDEHYLALCPLTGLLDCGVSVPDLPR